MVPLVVEVTRERAWETLTRYTKSEALLRHALAVEAVALQVARQEQVPGVGGARLGFERGHRQAVAALLVARAEVGQDQVRNARFLREGGGGA